MQLLLHRGRTATGRVFRLRSSEKLLNLHFLRCPCVQCSEKLLNLHFLRCPCLQSREELLQLSGVPVNIHSRPQTSPVPESDLLIPCDGAGGHAVHMRMRMHNRGVEGVTVHTRTARGAGGISRQPPALLAGSSAAHS